MTACLVLLGLVWGCGPGAHRLPESSVLESSVPESSVVVSPVLEFTTAAILRPGARGAGVLEDRWVAEDKVRHFAASFAATSMAYGGARVALEPAAGRNAAVGVALLLGVGKELVDARRGGPFSWKDLAWDAAGVALGYTLAQRIQ